MKHLYFYFVILFSATLHARADSMTWKISGGCFSKGATVMHLDTDTKLITYKDPSSEKALSKPVVNSANIVKYLHNRLRKVIKNSPPHRTLPLLEPAHPLSPSSSTAKKPAQHFLT